MSNYYNVWDDVHKYNNECWCFLAIGGRNTGKTYGALKYCKEHNIKFVFVKRTIDDVNLLCGDNSNVEMDLSPFKPINRDCGYEVKARKISNKGIGGFWDCVEGEYTGSPIGYIIALSAVYKFKGFDMSDADVIIFDEFIPQFGERVNKREGELILDLYKTVDRDRTHRGRKPLLLIALANAVSLSNPLCNILEVVNDIALMSKNNDSLLLTRGVCIRLVKNNDDFMVIESNNPIYKTMQGTAWESASLNNNFAYEDLSHIGKIKMKNYIAIAKVMYKNYEWYIYKNGRRYYMTVSSSNKVKDTYALDIESEQKRFNINLRIKLLDACIDDRIVFEHYLMYDMVMNYTKYFTI